MNLKEPLLGIGTIVEADTEHEGESDIYLIIGRRAYNPHTGKSWDYISVPYKEGYKMNNKTEHPYEESNMYFLNHIDIKKVIKNMKDVI